MSNYKASTAQARLGQVKDFLTGNMSATTIPFDPNASKFPSRKDIPQPAHAPKDLQTSWVWGENDQIGRLNLLTPTRIKAAAKSEIQSGELVSLNLPLNYPTTPGFARQAFHHEIRPLAENVAYDDFWNANTQSGTQWDGFRHFAHLPTQTFYNGTKATDIVGPAANLKCSQHYWGDHGIAGRGILLDWKDYAERKGIPFNPYESDSISLAELQACGKDQGIDIRPASQGGDVQVGDMLFVRSGFISSYFSKTPEERETLALRPHALGPDDGQHWAGLKQEDPMLDWLHDCWFATVAGDSPTFEAWPTPLEYYLHEYVLALWGCAIGEMLDLEQLSRTCREKGRWTFFVTSSPANVHGGVASHVNGLAIF